MPAFVHPALLWGLGLLAAPILIHLINLWRHRRVEWAAMEFLLESQRKNRRWVVLRQLLLLAARMAILAALVLTLAQPILANRWGSIVGGARTHHVVLWDDSYSMSDRWAEASAFDRGRAAIERILEHANVAGGGQVLTLLRYSRAGGARAAAAPDATSAPINAALREELAVKLKALAPSETASGPQAALAAAEKLIDRARGEQVVLYLVSDFRANQWRQPQALRESLAAWNARGAQVRLVRCVDKEHENLAVIALAPQRGMLAAGVPFFMEATVKNHGRESAREVTLSLQEDGANRPAVVIDEIPAGQSVQRRFLVNFPTAGEHVVRASLASDSVLADNQRSAVVDVPVGSPVLIVDGDPEASDARFLALALSPGGAIRTGVDARVEAPRYLVDHPLDGFKTIFLTNVAQLDEAGVAALETFVRGGGGLGIFLGEASDSTSVNERLYRDGQGLMPLAVTSPTQLFADTVEKRPDLEVTDHPMFRVFAGERNSFLSAVSVERYFTVAKDAEQKAGGKARVIARLRNGAPLAIEQKFGAGRVVAILTTAAPTWNNWGRNPSFVVAMLELQSYLATLDERQPARLVGSPMALEFDGTRFQPRMQFVVPGEESETINHDARRVDGKLLAKLADPAQSGIYEARLTTTDGRMESRRFVVDVDPEEGNLAIVEPADLQRALTGLRLTLERADDVHAASADLAGLQLSDSLLLALLALLLGEQALAYRNSYHAARSGGRG
jgi:hypothetical protein